MNKTTHFNIPGARQQRSLYLVVAKDICLETNNNVISYLYLNKKTPYKFYYLELCEKFDAESKKTKLGWTVREMALLTDAKGNLRLPDDTVLLCYDPKLIAGLEGGCGLDLPTIKIIPDILIVAGSEKSLHDQSNMILCGTALTMDAVHRELQQETRPSADRKTIVTITT